MCAVCFIVFFYRYIAAKMQSAYGVCCDGGNSVRLRSLFASAEQSGQEMIEIAFEHYAYALCGQCRAQVVVLVVEVVVGFQAQ